MKDKIEEKYSMESVFELMSKEEYGLHISLIDSGVDEKSKKPKMGIVVESDMSPELVQSLLWGLLEQYEEVGLN